MSAGSADPGIEVGMGASMLEMRLSKCEARFNESMLRTEQTSPLPEGVQLCPVVPAPPMASPSLEQIAALLDSRLGPLQTSMTERKLHAINAELRDEFGLGAG